MESDNHPSLHDAEAGASPMALVSVWDGRETVLAMPFAAVGLAISFVINTSFGLSGAMAMVGLFGPVLAMIVCMFVFLALFARWSHVDVRDGLLVLDRRDERGLTVEMDRIIAVESEPDRLLAKLPGKGLPIDLHTDQGVLRFWATADVREQLREAVMHARPGAIDFYGRADMRIPPPDDHARMWLDEYTQKIHRLLQHANGRSAIVIGIGLLIAGVVFTAALLAVMQGTEPNVAFNRFVLSLIIVAGFVAVVKVLLLWRNVCRFRVFQQQLQEAADDPLDAVTTAEGRVWLYRDEARPHEVSPAGKGYCVMGLLLGCLPVVGFALSLAGLYHTWVDDHGPWRSTAWLGVAIGFFSTSFLITKLII